MIGAGLPGARHEDIEPRVEVRMQRQDVLRNDNPLELWAIVDEAAVRRQVGGPTVLQAQLGRLLEAAELPNITFQVIPFTVGAHAGMPGSFVFMQFAEATIPDVIYLDSMAGDLFLEAEADVRHLDSMAGDLFLEAEADVRRYRLAFEHLRAVAVSPDASRALVAALAAEV